MEYQAKGLLIFMWSVLYIAGVCDDCDKLDDDLIIVINLTMNVCVFVGIDE